MKNITSKINDVEGLIQKSTTVDTTTNESEMVMIPMAMYELGESRHERRENKLLKLISNLCIAFVITLVVLVGGVLLFLNQYDFTYDFYQEQSNTMGDATIEDGIKYNQKEISDIIDKEW